METEDAILTIEQDADGLLITVFHFQYHLATGTAGRNRRLEKTVLIAGGYRQGGNRQLRIIALRTKDGTALGTQSRWECRILLIGAYHHFAVGKKTGCTYVEMAVVGISVIRSVHRLLHQLLLCFAQLRELSYLVLDL